MSDSPRQHSRVAPVALVAAAVASAVTTFVIARFGLTGTILGAALAPVIVALVAEGVRRPAERVRTTVVLPARRNGGEGPPPPAPRERAPRRRGLSLGRVSWRRVLATGLGAFLIVVLAFTLFDLARGESPVSDRGTTFFTPGQRGPADSPLEDPSPDPPEPREEDPAEQPPAEEPPPAPEPAPPPPTMEPAPPPPATETTP